MPTPRKGYYLKDGTRVPGTTTVLGRFKNSSGLMIWAFNRGKSGVESLYDQDALDIGTCVHSMVEHSATGASDEACMLIALGSFPDNPENHQKSLSGFRAYRSWAENFKVRIVEHEIQLVSEKHRFGGTPDAIGLIGNELALLDWKTSNSVYGDHIIQLAAYKNLWEECFPDRPITGGAHLLRFAKENGDFAHHYFDDLSNEWEQFLDFRRCYDRDKKISKRAA